MNKKQSHQRQRDAGGLTDKDHVFRAYLANQDITSAEARKLVSQCKVSTIDQWLSKAKTMWREAAPHEKGLSGIQPCVPKATRKLWDRTRAIAKQQSPRTNADKTKTPHKVKRQPDPFLRRQVERIAVEETARYFISNGYIVDSVEKDNVGWDLVAVRGQETLRLEVKGVSGADICVELTPNEYAKMQEYCDSYRLCVVTSALTNPQLTVFVYDNDTQCWADEDGRPLEIEKRVAARCRMAR